MNMKSLIIAILKSGLAPLTAISAFITTLFNFFRPTVCIDNVKSLGMRLITTPFEEYFITFFGSLFIYACTIAIYIQFGVKIKYGWFVILFEVLISIFGNGLFKRRFYFWVFFVIPWMEIIVLLSSFLVLILIRFYADFYRNYHPDWSIDVNGSDRYRWVDHFVDLMEYIFFSLIFGCVYGFIRWAFQLSVLTATHLTACIMYVIARTYHIKSVFVIILIWVLSMVDFSLLPIFIFGFIGFVHFYCFCITASLLTSHWCMPVGGRSDYVKQKISYALALTVINAHTDLKVFCRHWNNCKYYDNPNAIRKWMAKSWPSLYLRSGINCPMINKFLRSMKKSIVSGFDRTMEIIKKKVAQEKIKCIDIIGGSLPKLVPIGSTYTIPTQWAYAPHKGDDFTFMDIRHQSGKVVCLYGSPITASCCAKFSIIYKFAADHDMLYELEQLDMYVTGGNLAPVIGNDWDTMVGNLFIGLWPSIVAAAPKHPTLSLPRLPPANTDLKFLIDYCSIFNYTLSTYTITNKQSKVDKTRTHQRFFAQGDALPSPILTEDSTDPATFYLTSIVQGGTSTYHLQVPRYIPNFANKPATSIPLLQCGIDAVSQAYDYITGSVTKGTLRQTLLDQIGEIRRLYGTNDVTQLTLPEIIYLIKVNGLGISVIEYGNSETMTTELYNSPSPAALIGHNTQPAEHWFLVKSHFRLTNIQAAAVKTPSLTELDPDYSYYLNTKMSLYVNGGGSIKLDTSIAGQVMNGSLVLSPSISTSSNFTINTAVSVTNAKPTYKIWDFDVTGLRDANTFYGFSSTQQQIIVALFGHLFPDFSVAFGTEKPHQNVFKSLIENLLLAYSVVNRITTPYSTRLLVVPGDQNCNLLDGTVLSIDVLGNYVSPRWNNIITNVSLDTVSLLIPYGPHAYIVVSMPGLTFTPLTYFPNYLGYATSFAHSELKTMSSLDRVTKINRIHNYALVKVLEKATASPVEQTTLYEYLRCELPILEASVNVESNGLKYKGQTYERWLHLQSRSPINRWSREMFDHLYDMASLTDLTDIFWDWCPPYLKHLLNEHVRMTVVNRVSNMYYRAGNTIKTSMPLYKCVSDLPVANKFIELVPRYNFFWEYKWMFYKRIGALFFMTLQLKHIARILLSYEIRGYGAWWGVFYLIIYVMVDFITWFSTVTLFTTGDDKVTLALLRLSGSNVSFSFSWKDLPEWSIAIILYCLGIRLTQHFNEESEKISQALVRDLYLVVCNGALWVAFGYDYWDYIYSFFKWLVTPAYYYIPWHSYLHDFQDIFDWWTFLSEKFNFNTLINNLPRDWFRPVGGTQHYIEYQKFDDIAAPTWSLQKPCYYTREGKKLTDFYELKEYIKTTHVEVENKKIKRTGPLLLDVKGGKAPHCFSSSAFNLFSGVFARHTASLNVANMGVRHDFSNFNRRKVAKIAQKVNSYFKLNGVSTLEEYLDHLPPNKRGLYMQGVLKYEKHATVKMQLEGFMKKHELLYGSILDSRPRTIWCPDETLRVFAGWYSYNLIKAVKDCLPSFTHGLDCGGLADKLHHARIQIPNATNIDWDGSAHDSNQHAWWIDSVDNVLINNTIFEFGARAGWSIGLIRDIQKACTALDFPIIVYYPGTRQPMVRGVLSGTVFSGHPTRTTLGNTLRVHLLVEWVMKNASIKKVNYRHFVAGDDVLIFLNIDYISAFEKSCYTYMTQYNGIFGIGYKLKKIEKRGNGIDFLSKTGVCLDTSEPVLHRYLDRTVIGANYTHKLKKGFGPPEHAWAVTSSILSWCNGLSPIMEYVDYRRQQVAHSVPKKRSDIFWNDPESYYKLVSHANDHATEEYFSKGKPYLPALEINYFVNDPLCLDSLDKYRYRN